jgi:hypothetical protein
LYGNTEPLRSASSRSLPRAKSPSRLGLKPTLRWYQIQNAIPDYILAAARPRDETAGDHEARRNGGQAQTDGYLAAACEPTTAVVR